MLPGRAQSTVEPLVTDQFAVANSLATPAATSNDALASRLALAFCSRSLGPHGSFVGQPHRGCKHRDNPEVAVSNTFTLALAVLLGFQNGWWAGHAGCLFGPGATRDRRSAGQAVVWPALLPNFWTLLLLLRRGEVNACATVSVHSWAVSPPWSAYCW